MLFPDMEGSLANKEQAEKCRDMAKKFLQQGEHQKAVRFFEKSLRLYPLPGVDAMRDLAKVGGCLGVGSCDFLDSHKCSFFSFVEGFSLGYLLAPFWSTTRRVQKVLGAVVRSRVFCDDRGRGRILADRPSCVGRRCEVESLSVAAAASIRPSACGVCLVPRVPDTLVPSPA